MKFIIQYISVSNAISRYLTKDIGNDYTIHYNFDIKEAKHFTIKDARIMISNSRYWDSFGKFKILPYDKHNQKTN